MTTNASYTTKERRRPICPNCGEMDISEWSRTTAEAGLEQLAFKVGHEQRYPGGPQVHRELIDVNGYDNVHRSTPDATDDVEEYRCRNCEYASTSIEDFWNADEAPEYPDRDEPVAGDHLRRLVGVLEQTGAVRTHLGGHTALAEVVEEARVWLAEQTKDPEPAQGVWVSQEQLAGLLEFFFDIEVGGMSKDPRTLQLTRSVIKPTHTEARPIGADTSVTFDAAGERVTEVPA